MTKVISNFSELTEGIEYEIYCHQFDVKNKAIFICGDTTHLKRDISYWQFSERGFIPINRLQLIIMFLKDDVPWNVFALWGHDLKHNTITEIN
jgi:hypothetical protein